MKRRMSAAALVSLGAFVLAALSAVLLLASSDNAAHAQSSPSVAVSLSDTSVEQGAAITATMSFGGLTSDSDTSITDYIFRADVLDSDDQDADGCEGGGMGKDRYMHRVDEDPEVRTATVSAGCPAGAYTLRVSLSSAGNTELASASAGFFILGAPVVIEPPTLTALSVSHGNPAVDVALSPAFESETLAYSADVKAERVTIAPTAGDADAAIAYLDGNGDAIGDADTVADGQQVDLAAGSNTVRVAVSRDGLTTTYDLTLFRLATQRQSTDTTLVSSIYTRTSSFIMNSRVPKYAQSFETGSNSGGYNLASAGIKIYSVPTQSSHVEVTIREEDSGNPSGTAFATLTNPATFTFNSVNTFTAPANTVLAEDTTYFVHIERVGTSNASLRATSSSPTDLQSSESA